MSIEQKAEAFWVEVEKTGMAHEFSPKTHVIRSFIEGHKAGVVSVQPEMQLLRDQAFHLKRQCKALREELGDALTMIEKIRNQKKAP